MPIIAYNTAKMKQMVFKDLLSNPKYGIIYFGAQTKGWLAISEPNLKPAYTHPFIATCNQEIHCISLQKIWSLCFYQANSSAILV